MKASSDYILWYGGSIAGVFAMHGQENEKLFKLLNEHETKKQKQFKELSTIMPVNYVCNGLYHCDNKNIQ